MKSGATLASQDDLLKNLDLQPRKKISDKERARKSRIRKKKYYEDLESRVVYLEDRCEKLTHELEYCKHKLHLYEYGPSSTEEVNKLNTILYKN